MTARLVILLALAALALPVGAAASGPSSQVEEGHHLYGQYCISCHAAEGKGSAGRPAGAGPLRLQHQTTGLAPSLQGVGALAADFYLRTGYMPLPHLGMQPRRRRVFLTEAQIRALTAYVASLGPGPAVPTPHPERGSISEGFHLFTDHCAGCHQVVAEGGYVTGALPPSLEDATATQIAEAVRIGPYVMPTFSKEALSDRQLDSIIRYVEYAKHPDDRGGWAIGHLGPIPEGFVTWFIAMTALVAVCIVIGKRLQRG
jgi:ubiquinol-cytochrome c reductase cytochrome c subunit